MSMSRAEVDSYSHASGEAAETAQSIRAITAIQRNAYGIAFVACPPEKASEEIFIRPFSADNGQRSCEIPRALGLAATRHYRQNWCGASMKAGLLM
jgi:hypothetical protein